MCQESQCTGTQMITSNKDSSVDMSTVTYIRPHHSSYFFSPEVELQLGMNFYDTEETSEAETYSIH